MAAGAAIGLLAGQGSPISGGTAGPSTSGTGPVRGGGITMGDSGGTAGVSPGVMYAGIAVVGIVGLLWILRR